MTFDLRLWLLMLYTLGICVESLAQNIDSVRTLKEVVISSKKLEVHSVGYRLESVDSMALSVSNPANLTELLFRNTTAQVRSFGISGVSIPNIRGTGSSHSAILWNGINLQSPASGQLDVSLSPNSFADEVILQSGGSASLYGAGIIGGAIHLNNRPRFNEGLILETSQSIGSFGRYFQNYTIGWSNGQFHSQAQYFRYSAENDFEFVNQSLFDRPLQRREHNRFEQQGILWQTYWRVSERDQLSFRFWWQDNDFQVPTPTTVAAPGNANQNDQFNRSLINWEHQGNQWDWSYKSALINHETNFRDTLTNLDSRTTYHSLINEFEGSTSVGQGELTAGINYTHEWVESANFGSSNPSRNRVATYMAWRRAFGVKFITDVRFRQEIVGSDFTPFSPSLGLEYYLLPQLVFKGSFSRNYLIPTFNQLFWTGAGGIGNPALQREESWSEEVGVIWSPSFSDQWSNSLEVTGFGNQVDNWILWIPVTSSEWSPRNIKEVWSRGLEMVWSSQLEAGKFKLNLTGNYSWTRSTNQSVSEEGNLSEIGQQLIYTPLHAGKLSGTIERSGYGLGWWHQFVGEQFTTGDNSPFQKLPSYGASTVVLSKSISLNQIKSSIQFEVNNLFNQNYLVRAGYPMPLRNYRITISLKY